MAWCGLFGLGGGCGSGDLDVPGAVPPRVDAGRMECIDDDGDGYGEGCGDPDCDDADPEVTDLCFRCGRAPREDCPCEPGTAPETTCTPPPIVGEQDGVVGSFVCSEGTRYCRDGLWSVCEAIGEYVFVPGR